MLRGQSSFDMFITKDYINKAKLDAAVLEQEDKKGQTEVHRSYTKNWLESDLITFNQIKDLIKKNTYEIRKAIEVSSKRI